jgi:hypothetical protein
MFEAKALEDRIGEDGKPSVQILELGSTCLEAILPMVSPSASVDGT